MSVHDHEELDGPRQSVRTKRNYFARLHRDSPFYSLFPDGIVPVKEVPAPGVWNARGWWITVLVTCALCGDARDPEPCLWLDWTRCSDSQANDVAHIVTELRGGNIREFISYMDRGGDMPVRCSQVDGAPFPL